MEWLGFVVVIVVAVILMFPLSLAMSYLVNRRLKQIRERRKQQAGTASDIANEIYAYLCGYGDRNVFLIASDLLLPIEKVREGIALLASKGLIEQMPVPGVKLPSDDHIPWGLPRTRLSGLFKRKKPAVS